MDDGIIESMNTSVRPLVHRSVTLLSKTREINLDEDVFHNGVFTVLECRKRKCQIFRIAIA